MGYLAVEESPLPDFTKAVISLWFRVSTASLLAAQNAAPSGSYPPLPNIVPLVVFGGPMTQTVYDSPDAVLATSPNLGFDGSGDWTTLPGYWTVDQFTPANPASEYLDPSYIGLYVDSSGEVFLQVNVQTNVRAILVGFSVLAAPPDIVVTPGYPNGPNTGAREVITLTPPSVVDYSYAAVGAPEAYQVRTDVGSVSAFADRWHHVLFSCDISNDVVTQATSASDWTGVLGAHNSMWVALDDADINGAAAFPNQVPGQPPNAVLSAGQYLAVANNNLGGSDTVGYDTPLVHDDTSGPGTNCFTLNTLTVTRPATTCTTTAGPIPVNGRYFGFPADASHVNNIYKIDLAEFQMFTGVTLDTSVEANRRAFIGKDHKPVDPGAMTPYTPNAAGSDPLMTYPPGAPIKLLGKRPDIAFTRSCKNWMAGVNCGTLRHAGFKSAGKIKPFLPSPKLGK